MYIDIPTICDLANPNLFPIHCSFTVGAVVIKICDLVFYTLKNVFGKQHRITITINYRMETTYYIQEAYVYTLYVYILHIFMSVHV